MKKDQNQKKEISFSGEDFTLRSPSDSNKTERTPPLIKKLEETSLPEIEVASHRARLRAALLSKYSKEKRSWEVFSIFKKLAPIGAVAIILTILAFNNLIFPKYSITEAEKIALGDSRIKAWLVKGAIIKDTEIIKNKAYVLVQFSREAQEEAITLKPEPAERGEESIGVLAEVDFKEKRVSKVEGVMPLLAPLTEDEKERAKEIIKNSPEVQEVLPGETKIREIISAPQLQLQLSKRENAVEIISEANVVKEAVVIYESDKQQWESKVNLNEGKVETINFLGEVEE